MRLPWVIILVALVALLAACGGGGDDDDEEPTPEETGDGTPGPLDGDPVGVEDLAHAVVQIFALDSSGETVWTGSGTIISPDGLILTNAHVVDDRFEEYDQLGVAITEQTDEPPELEFIGEIAAVDYALDLAVVEITEGRDGGSVLQDFPFVELGDSDGVEIGDEVRILGYPGIGGETITFTRGAVSGFTSERSVGNRAWIKTDATIAGGNSGGLATNADGQLVGVPTIAGSGADASSVDCRIIQDTNGDGFLDETDSCVPVGGFINGLRPVNLALDLVESAKAGDEYVSPYYEAEDIEETPGGGYDVASVELSNMVFSADVENDEPTEIVKLLPSGAERLCGFWDYEGMVDGMTWDAAWYINGEQDDGGSILGDTWVGGESGNWWVCIVDEETGLLDGIYELVIQIEGEPQGSDAIFVGGNHELVELTLDNRSATDICAAWVSPSEATNWGFEDLGADVFLDAGDAVTLEVATGDYDILLRDCDLELGDVTDFDVEVSESGVYTITDETLASSE
jgi:serine protease Do